MAFLSFLPIGIPASGRLVFRPIYPQEVVIAPEEPVVVDAGGGGAGFFVDRGDGQRRIREQKDEAELLELVTLIAIMIDNNTIH